MSDSEDLTMNTSLPALTDFFPLATENRDSGNTWYLSVKFFNSGDVEAMALKLNSDDSIRRGGGAKRENTEKKEMDAITLSKSQSRAKKTIRHRLMQMCSDRMLTLTYKENMTDLKQGWSDIKKFSRLMKEAFPEDWSYVCVPEFQKRGAVHFHMGISGYYPVNKVRAIWRAVVGEGNIDVTSPRQTIGKDSWNPKRIANYLGKYLSKEDSVEFNKRRYSSTSITLPTPITGWLALGLPIVSVLSSIITKMTAKEVGSVWSSDDGYFPIAMVST